MYWSKSMECGIPRIDHQHKQLFRQVESLLHGDKPERVLELFEFLEEYVVGHFAYEESMHAKAGYPKADIHRKSHADFIKTFSALRKEYERSGHTLMSLLEVNRVAVAWLKEHVMGEDMDFAKFHADARKVRSA